PIPAAHGMSVVPGAGLEALASADIVIVPGWDDPALPPSPALIAALRAAHVRGAQIVGLCLGSYVLAYAGLLDGHRASTHWEYEQDGMSRLPRGPRHTNRPPRDEDRLVTSART